MSNMDVKTIPVTLIIVVLSMGYFYMNSASGQPNNSTGSGNLLFKNGTVYLIEGPIKYHATCMRQATETFRECMYNLHPVTSDFCGSQCRRECS